MDLAVLLYHLDKSSGSNKETYYALKVDSFTLTIAKTPIQIPIPQNSPQLVDFGIFRPAITMSAIVDNGPANTSTTTTGSGATLVGYQGMETIVHGGTTYYIPYKNKLEDAIYNWVAYLLEMIHILYLMLLLLVEMLLVLHKRQVGVVML